MKPEATATILVIEDDLVVERLYEHVLHRPGWSVVVAPSLEAADRALLHDAVALVILDLFLPDGDGRTWLADLRQRAEHASTPVVVVASTSVVQARVDCYELGADTMLEKPVPPEVLVAAVSGALQRAAERAPPPAPPAPPVHEAPATSLPATRRVLLAEDDEVVAALVRHRLRREGFDVTHATHGVAALEIAMTEPLSLVVLDVMLPGLDGFEILTTLRSLPRTARLPIVMLTGLGGERDVERALELGADDYVLKPFSPVELTARVRRVLKGS